MYDVRVPTEEVCEEKDARYLVKRSQIPRCVATGGSETTLGLTPAFFGAGEKTYNDLVGTAYGGGGGFATVFGSNPCSSTPPRRLRPGSVSHGTNDVLP